MPPTVPPVDPSAPQTPPTTEPPKLLARGRTYCLGVGTHCGVAVLSRSVHGYWWRTDEADGSTGDWMPPEWLAGGHPANDQLTLHVVLSTDESRLTASYGGRSVDYRKVTPQDPEFSCA